MKTSPLNLPREYRPTKLSAEQIRAKLLECARACEDSELLDRCAVSPDGVVEFNLTVEPGE